MKKLYLKVCEKIGDAIWFLMEHELMAALVVLITFAFIVGYMVGAQ